MSSASARSLECAAELDHVAREVHRVSLDTRRLEELEPALVEHVGIVQDYSREKQARWQILHEGSNVSHAFYCLTLHAL